jgi:hypothetical protein
MIYLIWEADYANRLGNMGAMRPPSANQLILQEKRHTINSDFSAQV